MNRSNPAATLLFWLMILVGGASLAASVWLPAWLEMRDAQARERSRAEMRDVLREHLTTLDRRRQHLENDPAYIDRIARREFGNDAADRESASVEIIGGIQMPKVTIGAPAAQAWETTVEHLAQTHPVVRLYVDPRVRWRVQVLSAALIFAAIFFLYRKPNDRAAEAGAGEGDSPEAHTA